MTTPAPQSTLEGYRQLRLLVTVLCALLMSLTLACSAEPDLRTSFAPVANSSRITASVVDKEFIVTFDQYLDKIQQIDLLKSILGNPTLGWRYLERDNPGALLPSDFALLRVDNPSLVAILSSKESKHVKHIFPQRRLHGVLQDVPLETTESEEELAAQRRELLENLSEKYSAGRFHGGFPREDFSTQAHRRKLHNDVSVPELFHAQYMWEQSFTGHGVKVAIFDTGITDSHPHFRNIVDRFDWTDEGTKEDLIGHGTFVAGVIASALECVGFAPDVDIYSFRVFTSAKVSYTSWFLDAFNYAIHKKINVLNLSIGGPDFMDLPFVEKVWEMSANGIVIISAIGNDGPIYGTLNNPADQLDVIGVGGIDFKDQLAAFSSRGMTTWELPAGLGRVKPDVVAYGQNVRGSNIRGGCKTLSGTSVASPVVAGAVALLASSIPEETRWEIVNPASMKQVLIEGASVLPGANIYEQGHGKLDLFESYQLLSHYTPRATFAPASLDLTDCPFMWPYCTQPLYYSSMPVIFNATILNGMGVRGIVKSPPRWIPAENGDMLEVSFTYSEILWPWSGWLGVHLRVPLRASKWQGTAQGLIELVVESPPMPGESVPRVSSIQLPIKANIIPTPPKAKRILWDQFHNLRYPSGYFPRDALWIKQEPFDWNGDHPFTNFKDFYNYLKEAGFYVEILGHPYTCFNATHYGTLLIVDPEEEFFPEEVAKLKEDVETHGLSVAVFADWYNADVMKKIKFFDENTKQWWTPVTGGSNIPALNDLLRPYNIGFGDKIYEGDIAASGQVALFASGAAISRFPKDGLLIPFELRDQSTEIVSGKTETHPVAVLGFYAVPKPDEENTHQPKWIDPANQYEDPVSGRIAVFGDSSCLDAAGRSERKNCFWLAREMLGYTSQAILPSFALEHSKLKENYISKRFNDPVRLEGNQLFKYSKVLGQTEPTCSDLTFHHVPIDENTALTELKWPDRTKANGPSGHFREELFRKPKHSVFGALGPQQVLWYFVVIVAVIAVAFAAFYIRARRKQAESDKGSTPKPTMLVNEIRPFSGGSGVLGSPSSFRFNTNV